MRLLQKDEFSLVKPKRVRELVQKAWDSGYDVPYGSILVADVPTFESDLIRARELNAIYKWK